MKLPTCVIGLVKGPLRREKCGGEDGYQDGSEYHLIVPLTDPSKQNPTDWAITHLQKKSKFGFLLMWPLCFHVWFTFKYQQQKLSDGNVLVDVPGSETVLYWRVGWKRWDAKDCVYIGPPTWYGPGLHWD